MVILVRKCRQPIAKRSTGRCTSPSCARCHGETEIQGKLLRRLREHVAGSYGVKPEDIPTYLSQKYARVLSTVESYDHKNKVLSTIYRESGHNDVSTHNLAHVWMMPGLTRIPLWTKRDHVVMEKLFSLFEDRENFEKVVQEYKLVSEMEDAWKTNQIPNGSWKTYFLMNQGCWLQENCARCPQTLHLLETIGCLMKGTVFGNVLFSVLRPGSKIEPHTAPCNFRLRCHFPLNASSGFSLHVGRCTATWKTGQLLVFDDSFVHSVSHKSQRGTPTEEENRVVLIFDIWHPDINPSERQALNCLFDSALGC